MIIKKIRSFFSLSIRDLLFTIIVLSGAVLIGLLLHNISFDDYNIPIIFILAITIISSNTTGYLYGLLASLMGMLFINFFFTYPFFTFNFIIADYPVTFSSMLIVSIITCTLTSRIKKQAIHAISREQKTNTLLVITKKLLATQEIENITALTIEYLQSTFHCEAVVYTSEPPLADDSINYSERYAANWAYVNGQEAGCGTENCTDAKGIYIPVVSMNHIIGVIGLYRPNSMILSSNQKVILNMITANVAMAIEKQNLSDERQRILLDSEKEKMRGNLLRAISHDLRTPLTGILGASSAILESGNQINKETHDKLIEDIHEDSQWLIRMVENLLSVTRINDETAKVSKAPEAVEEIVAEALGKIKIRFPKQKINVTVPNDVLIVPMDATLIEQVIINLIENSIKHASREVVVTLKIVVNENHAVFEISDTGNGINSNSLPYLFDGCTSNKNHASDSSTGMGLGLSICSSIVKAHSGDILAKNSDTGGAVFTFWLPIKE